VLPLTVPFFVTIGLAIVGYLLARRRALSVASGDIRVLNALPHQHGLNTALSTLLPPLAVMLTWALAVRIGTAKSVIYLYRVDWPFCHRLRTVAAAHQP
jgi:phosphate transport system permease protein